MRWPAVSGADGSGGGSCLGRSCAPGTPGRHLPRHHDVDVRPGRQLVDGREIVVVDVRHDRLRAGVLHDVRDGHLWLTGRQPDDLRVHVSEIDRRFAQGVRELHRIRRLLDVPCPAVGNRIGSRVVVGALVTLQHAHAGLDEQAAGLHSVVSELTELLGRPDHGREIGRDDVLARPFVAEVIDVGDLREPVSVVVVALVLQAADRPRPVESRRRVEALLRVGQIDRRGDVAVRDLMRGMSGGLCRDQHASQDYDGPK